MGRKTKTIGLVILLTLCSITIAFGTEENAVQTEVKEDPVKAVVQEEPVQIPQAVLPVDRYDFASVAEGVPVAHEFIIENSGTAPLIIEKVKTG